VDAAAPALRELVAVGTKPSQHASLSMVWRPLDWRSGIYLTRCLRRSMLPRPGPLGFYDMFRRTSGSRCARSVARSRLVGDSR